MMKFVTKGGLNQITCYRLKNPLRIKLAAA